MNAFREAIERQSGEDRELPPAVGTFLRGLSLGALVGAAIAGSALLQRRRHRTSEVASEESPAGLEVPISEDRGPEPTAD
jgi:hypothetical protein